MTTLTPLRSIPIDPRAAARDAHWIQIKAAVALALLDAGVEIELLQISGQQGRVQRVGGHVFRLDPITSFYASSPIERVTVRVGENYQEHGKMRSFPVAKKGAMPNIGKIVAFVQAMIAGHAVDNAASAKKRLAARAALAPAAPLVRYAFDRLDGYAFDHLDGQEREFYPNLIKISTSIDAAVPEFVVRLDGVTFLDDAAVREIVDTIARAKLRSEERGALASLKAKVAP